VACGRRWGKTELAARVAARQLGAPDSLVWWVAPAYDEADAGFKAIRDAIPNSAIEGAPKRTKPKGLALVNGSEISFRSADREDSLRAVGLDLLVIDEAAMVPERAWTEELRPTLSDTLGEMVAISTPKGRGWFYRWFQHGDNVDREDVDSWQAPTYDNPHVPDSEVDAARNELPERVWKQEYLAEFVSETGGVFEGLDDRLFTVEYDLPTHPNGDEPDSDGPYSTGVDFARHQDYRVIVTLDSAGRVVYFDRGQDEAWPQIQRAVEQISDAYPGVVSVDASRDNKIVADLEASGVPVRPVTFSATRKQELIENLISTVEAGEISAPEIPILRNELEVFEYDVTRAGNIRYDAPEGFHDDTVDALALAVDGLADATRQAASATATVGSDDGGAQGEGIMGAIREADRQSRGNKWK